MVDIIQMYEANARIDAAVTALEEADAALLAAISGKASTATVAALDTRVDAVETAITAETARATAAETLLDNSIAGAVTGLSEVINDLAEYTDTVNLTAQGARLTAGEQTLEYARGVMFGSATPILGPVGGINYVGFSTLGGYPTQLTFVTPRIFFDEATRARLTGRTVVFMSASELSPGFFPARKLSTTGVTVDIVGGGQRTNQGTVLADRQVGNMLYRMATYVMQGDEFFVGLPHQLANDSGTTGDHSLEIVSATYAIDAVPADMATTPADEQFAAKIAAYLDAEGFGTLPAEIAAKSFGFANDLSEFTPLPAFFNGAVARVGDDGRNWGWTVPAGQTGTTTLMQVSIPMRGMGYLLAGRTVRVSFAMDTSDDYSQFQAAGATFAVARPSNANLFLGTTITKAPTVDVSNPNRRFYEFSAVMGGTETVLKPFFRRGTQPAAAAEQFILVTDVTMEIVASPSDSLTLLEENLRLSEALRREAASEAVGGQISAAILGTGSEVITVGPSGAHFTTLSAAIDAVTDSSISKQYKICWKAGTLLGALSRVAPAWTSIIAADRNEDAVISYTLPTNATALAIRDAELLNVYQRMSIIEGGTWELGNGRYPFHAESSGGQPDTEQRFINVVARHLGNLTAVNNTWNIGSQFALGCGQSGGQILKIIDCDLSGPGGGFSTHGPNNAQPWLTPWVAEIENSKLVATVGGQFATRIVSLAVGPGRVSLRNSTLATMQLTDTGWVGGAPAGDVNTAQVDIIAASCSPFTFTNSITLGDPAGADYLPLIINPGA